MSEIALEAVLDIIRAGQMRVRMFGEAGIFGDDKCLCGDFEKAAALFKVAVRDGFLCLYQDEDGLFVGPPSPSLVERDPLAEGGALQ